MSAHLGNQRKMRTLASVKLSSPALARALPAAMMSMSMVTATKNSNPLLADWSRTEPYGLPPFGKIRPEHFKPAFTVGMAHQLQELQEIAECADEPTFENTIAAFDRCGGVLGQTGAVFSNLCSSNSPAELQAVQLEMAPVLAAHRSKVYTTPGLFERIERVHDSLDDDATLTMEQRRLTERIHLDFVRAGAKFDADAQARYSDIMSQLSTLLTQFQQNVMADESEVTIELTEVDMEGCPEFLISAARAAAREKGLEDGFVITLSRSLVEPFITFSPRRDLREKAWRLWTNRGQIDSSRDNRKIAKEILRLRVEQAHLHGYSSFAEYQNADSMAGTPARVMELLERVWEPACKSANAERAQLEQYLGDRVEPWDWRFCAEKVRLARYNFDEAALKPYLSLPSMQRALFDTAEKLFGLRFVRVDLAAKGIELYHPDVELYEVREREGDEESLVALFLHDNFARANKQSGAWMSEFRDQCRNWNAYDFGEEAADGGKGIATTAQSSNQIPIIINNNNFNKGEPCLLSFDDALTLFHEMGHGLHGMLSSVTYSRLSGTSVLRDFVELPSQLCAPAPARAHPHLPPTLFVLRSSSSFSRLRICSASPLCFDLFPLSRATVSVDQA